MKEHPILFSTPMVQSILEGRKTQTRRIVKTKHKISFEANNSERRDLEGYGLLDKNGNYIEIEEGMPATLRDFCKYSKGDILWVREEHYRYGRWILNGFTKNGRQMWKFMPSTKITEIRYFDNHPDKIEKNSFRQTALYKRLARFMPKSACRIWLEITDLRAERLQDISEEDAKAEGVIKCYQQSNGVYIIPDDRSIIMVGEHGDYYTGFKSVWESINGEQSWNDNPFVWVVEFKILSTTGK